MKEELEKLIDARIEEMQDSVEFGYLSREVKDAKEKRILLLQELRSALFGF